MLLLRSLRSCGAISRSYVRALQAQHPSIVTTSLTHSYLHSHTRPPPPPPHEHVIKTISNPMDAVDKLFRGRRPPSTYSITHLLATHSTDMTTSHLCHLLQAAAKMRVTLTDASWKCLQNASEAKCTTLHFTKREITAAFYGLRHLTDTPMARKLLKFLLQSDSSQSRIDNLSPQQLGLVLQGLGPFSSKWSVVRQAITLITERMKTLSDNGETFSAPQAGGTLFALRGFRSDCMEVHGLLNSLSDMLNVSFPSSSTRRLAGRDFVLGLEGMALMNNSDESVRNFLDSLLRASINTTTGAGGNGLIRLELSTHEIARGVNGMQSMKVGGLLGDSAKDSEVQAVLSVLATSLRFINEKSVGASSRLGAMHTHDVAMLLWGLQGMSLDGPEPESPELAASGLRSLLSTLSRNIELVQNTRDGDSGPQFTEKQFIKSIFGLQKIGSANASVDSILKFLISRFPSPSGSEANNKHWSLLDISLCLQGISSIGIDQSYFVKEVFSRLLCKIPPHQSDELMIDEIDLEAVCNCMNALKELQPTFSLLPEVSKFQEMFNCYLVGVTRVLNASVICPGDKNEDRISAWAHSSEEGPWSVGKLSVFLKYRAETRSSSIEVRNIMKKCKLLRSLSTGYVRGGGKHSALPAQRHSLRNGEVLALVREIDVAMSEMIDGAIDNSNAWRWQDISRCVYSLQHLDSHDDQVLLLLNKIHTILSRDGLLEDTGCTLSALAHCLFGMRGMDANNSDVEEILAIIVNKLDSLLNTSKLNPNVNDSNSHDKSSDERLLGMCLSGLLTLDFKSSELSSAYLTLSSKLIHRFLDSRGEGKVEALHGASGTKLITSQTAAAACYYMQNLGLHQEGAKELLGSMHNLLSETRRGNKQFNHQEVAMALLGFKNKFSPLFSSELQHLIEDVLSMMQSSQTTSTSFVRKQPWTPLPGLTVALGLYGLSGVNVEHHEAIMHRILKWFSVNLSIARIQEDISDSDDEVYRGAYRTPLHLDSLFTFSPSSSLQLRPHEVALASYGLRQYSSDTPEVRSILAFLTQCIHNNAKYLRHQYTMRPQSFVVEVSMLMYGLKRMHGDVPEVRSLVDAIAAWLEVLDCSDECIDTQGDSAAKQFAGSDNEKFSSSEFANTMAEVWLKNELRDENMGTENSSVEGLEEVEQNLRYDSRPLLRDHAMLDHQAIGMCLSGLRYLKSGDLEVKRLMTAITQLMKKTRRANDSELSASASNLSLWKVAKVMSGIGNDNMSLEHREVRELVKELAYVVDTSSLVDEDYPFLAASPSSIINKHKTVDELLGEVSTGIISLLASSSTHVRIFGLEDSIAGSRQIKGNVPLLHHSVIELFDTLLTVVNMMDADEESNR